MEHEDTRRSHVRPVTKQEIDRWVAEGASARTASCRATAAEPGKMRMRLPVLRRADSTSFGDARQERDAAMPCGLRSCPGHERGAHRGALILALASSAVQLPSVWHPRLGPWQRRSSADAGRTDGPSGMALTQAGICSA